MVQDTIRVVDAFQNNLKHISVDIAKHQITVVTGMPKQMLEAEQSVTAPYLKKALI